MLPHGGLAAQVVLSRGVPSLAMLLQIPTLEASRQLWHAPSQATLQQTPSLLHTPLVQSELALQLSPFANLLPQWLLVLRQVSPVMQSASETQVVRHEGLVLLHT